ncbi:hypothetical protein BS50DRAFT_249678 [Corynespora cassiicola Philippines]|uniref:Uncharacterized protein n=1 Tax=Corynespora cassiicola Philippines TaxID=1448308 RepID=A0A2T2P3W9_CORCC|nr:hypothetical protein BS50DRAFT_249678 [Corynespora cassiicola Philippines]
MPSTPATATRRAPTPARARPPALRPSTRWHPPGASSALLAVPCRRIDGDANRAPPHCHSACRHVGPPRARQRFSRPHLTTYIFFDMVAAGSQPSRPPDKIKGPAERPQRRRMNFGSMPPARHPAPLRAIAYRTCES